MEAGIKTTFPAQAGGTKIGDWTKKIEDKWEENTKNIGKNRFYQFYAFFLFPILVPSGPKSLFSKGEI